MFYRIVILYWLTIPAALRARFLINPAVDYSANENYRIIY